MKQKEVIELSPSPSLGGNPFFYTNEKSESFIIDLPNVKPKEIVVVSLGWAEFIHQTEKFSLLLEYANEKHLKLVIFVEDALARFVHMDTQSRPKELDIMTAIMLEGGVGAENLAVKNKNAGLIDKMREENRLWICFSDTWRSKENGKPFLDCLSLVENVIEKNSEIANRVKKILEIYKETHLVRPFVIFEIETLLEMYIQEKLALLLMWQIGGHKQVMYLDSDSLINKAIFECYKAIAMCVNPKQTLHDDMKLLIMFVEKKKEEKQELLAMLGNIMSNTQAALKLLTSPAQKAERVDEFSELASKAKISLEHIMLSAHLAQALVNVPDGITEETRRSTLNNFLNDIQTEGRQLALTDLEEEKEVKPSEAHSPSNAFKRRYLTDPNPATTGFSDAAFFAPLSDPDRTAEFSKQKLSCEGIPVGGHAWSLKLT